MFFTEFMTIGNTKIMVNPALVTYLETRHDRPGAAGPITTIHFMYGEVAVFGTIDEVAGKLGG